MIGAIAPDHPRFAVPLKKDFPAVEIIFYN